MVEAADGYQLDSYLHIQGGRVNAVLAEMADASPELAHDIAVHIAFARPKYLTRGTSPPTSSSTSVRRWKRRAATRGKPEQALAKIVEGRLGGFFKDVALLDQPYAKDDKQSVKQFIGSATIVRFAQVEIG